MSENSAEASRMRAMSALSLSNKGRVQASISWACTGTRAVRRTARVPVHAHEMLAWTLPLFDNESADMARIREASALFSDIAWRRHPDDRAVGAFGQVLTAPFAGANHRARAVIAASMFHRYSGDEDFPQHMELQGLLDKDDERRALVLGLAWR